MMPLHRQAIEEIQIRLITKTKTNPFFVEVRKALNNKLPTRR